MKFACDSCQAEFLIADEKVGRRGVKVRCKRCSHVIIVRPTLESLSNLNGASDAEPEADHAAMPPPLDDESDPRDLNPSENIPTEMEGPSEDGSPEENRPDSAVGFSGEATQVTPAPQATVPLTDAANADAHPEPQVHAPDLLDEMTSDAEENSLPAALLDEGEDEDEDEDDGFASDEHSDELDEQLEGAFAQMFDDATLASAPSDEDDEDFTNLQSLGAMPQGFAGADFSSPLSPSLLGMAAELEAAGTATDFQEQPAEQAPIWFLAVGDENVGPMSLHELQGYYDRGEMDGASLVWQDEMPDWEHASQVPALDSLFQSPISPLVAGGLAAEGLFVEPGLILASPAPQMPSNEVAASPLDLGVSPLDGAFGASSFGDLSSSADEGWKPGAASALASLVEAEMQRPDEASPQFGQSSGTEGPPMPAIPMDESEIGNVEAAPAALFAAPIAGAAATQSTPPTAAVPNANFAPIAPTHPAILSNAPYGAPVAASRPVWQYGAMVIAAIGVVALFKIAFFGPASEAVVPRQVQQVEAVVPVQPTPSPSSTAAPQPSVPAEAVASAATATQLATASPPAVPASPQPAVSPTPVAPVAPAASPIPTAPVASPPANTPPAAPKAKKAKKSRAPRAEPAPLSPEPPKVAVVEPQAAPEKPVEERPARGSKKKSNPNCDPVLDFDCDEAPKKSRASASDSATQKSLSRDDVLIVVKKNLSGVHRCFDTHGGKGPVKMQWRIAKSGRPQKVKVLSDKYQDTPLGSCIQEKIRSWRFPKYSGQAPPPVTIPFKARS